MLILGAALVFVAIVLSLSIIGVITSERRGVARSVAAIKAIDSAPDHMKNELEKPFMERVIAPLGEQAVDLGKKLTRADTAVKLQHRLDIAGNPPGWDVNRIIGLKVLAMGVLAVLGFIYLLGLGFDSVKLIGATVALGAFGYVLPNLLLNNAGAKREASMQNDLPDALDLLTVSVEAGLGFDAAVGRVAKQTDGPLAAELSRMLQEMQLGMGRSDAMRAMGERSSLRDLKSFCMAMVQAESLGVPMGRVLRIQSSEMRTKRRQRAEAKAMQVPVKIMVPMILFILPCLFLIILGPAALQMVGALG